MPIRPDLQLEKCIDDALIKNDFKPLKTLLQIDICGDVTITCSKQLLHKLDELVRRELNKKDIQTVSAILVSFGRCGKNISILGQAGLLTMIKQGLVQKMVGWFEKSKEIILTLGNSKDEAVINMIEDLFDLFMAIHDISDEECHFMQMNDFQLKPEKCIKQFDITRDSDNLSFTEMTLVKCKRQIVESFVPRICVMVIDSRVNICIQQETLKKMNAMLDKMPQDARKILSNQEMFILMSSMGERILDAGDYDLQVGIVEALCRMTTEKQRQEQACRWFSMDFVANAFKGIKDSEFETDCRVFLNLVNGMLGDKRRVFTFPCLSAFLDEYELKIPSDEKLEEFWIDFNLGSQSLSFYIAGDNDDHQWEAVTVPEGKVQIYSIEVRESKKLLTIILENIIKISKKEGKELLLYFDASLEIASVTQKIFGANKYREFTRKQGISVAKTSVHILFDARGSQILVPESQISPKDEELISLKEKPYSQKEFAKPPKGIKNSTQGSRKTSQPEITTPSKRKMSEASMIVPGTDRYTVRSPVLLINTSTPRRRRRIKPPLRMMSSAEKPDIPKTPRSGVDSVESHASRPSEGRRSRDNTDTQVSTAKVAEKTENDTEFPNQNFNELQDTVPDSQTVRKIDQPVSSAVLDDICGSKMNSEWSCWAPVTSITLCNNRRADIVINKKPTTQKSSSSISDDCEETEKVQYKKKTMHHNEIDTVEEGVCKRDNQQQLNHPQLSEQKNIENTEQNDWRIGSATTLKSVLLNKTVEESLIYRKKYIVSKDVRTAVCDRSPSPGKNTKSHRKSGKRLTSELNPWDLEQRKMGEKSEEKGFTDAAESLINQLNKRYKPKGDMKSTRKFTESLIGGGFSNKSDLQLSKEKVQKKSYRQLKTTFVNVTSECPLNDVYNFNLNGADEPVIKLGIQEFQATATEACVDNSIKLIGLRNHDELEPSLKTKDKRIVENHKRKNLFSDSDTECKTDISWLKGPKPKPPLADYSRGRNAKKRKSGQSRPSLERGQSKSKMTSNKNATKKVEETVPYGRARLPRRATKTKKNYKDLSNSESESDQEFSHSFKEKLLVKEENIHSRRKTRKLPKKQKKASSAETQKDISKEWKNSSLLKDAIRERSLGLSPASLSGSASSTEVMRGNAGTEEVTEKRFTQDYDCVTKSVSPYLKTSSPESLNSTYGSSIKSPKNNDKNLCARERCSPIPRSCSLGEPPASPLSVSSEGREQIWCDVPCDSTHASGPTPHLSRKRRYIEEDDLSDAEVVELEEEEEEGGVYLLPRKLSRTEETDNHTYKVSESISPLSTNDLSPPAESWESEISDTGMMREQLTTEFRKEFPNCQKSMEYFIKQSWQTTRRHLNAVNRQIQEYRIKKLDKFQFVIIEELENFEKDSQSLKDLEKEFVDFGEKLFQKFSAYQESERQRLLHLKTSLAKNVFYSTDHEDTVFKSQMCSLKEDMRALQEGLLKDVQEEELLKVRRGLLSLFMAHEGNIPV